MTKFSVDNDRLLAAYARVRDQLVAERKGAPHWTGRLSSSALSTATAISALSIVQRCVQTGEPSSTSGSGEVGRFNHLIARGLEWLAGQQNADGGWGDTDKSVSNISTTMLVRAAFHLTAVPAKHAAVLERADAYCRETGGVEAVARRYGKDKTFAVPILANCALAGLVDWRKVSPLPFELSCFPQSMFRFLRLPVVSYALPALIAIGYARFVHHPPWNPLIRRLRGAAAPKSLDVLESIQPASGGFLEATPLTSFVVMSLAGSGQSQHAVTQRGVKFLVDSVRDDGSWPIDTNLATWTTSLSMAALGHAGDVEVSAEMLDWLLGCQYREVHPFTGAAPGGWGWSDLSGAVPDADDTPAALIALDAVFDAQDYPRQIELSTAAQLGAGWLLGLQNRDGGWPTFCRGWGKLPFDRSAPDLTAHAIRAFTRWRRRWRADGSSALDHSASAALVDRIDRATRRGFGYLRREQRQDGSWLPLWFGNQANPEDENPVYGTSRVLLAYNEAGVLEAEEAKRGERWLIENQNADGGWGGEFDSTLVRHSSVEETAVAVEALLGWHMDDRAKQAVENGLKWLVKAVESGRAADCSPVGFYFAKLWYYEKLYPLIFCTAALGRAASLVGLPAGETSTAAGATAVAPTLR